MDKEKLRQAMIVKRQQLPRSETNAKSRQICARIKEFPPFSQAKTIGLYCPIRNEANLLPLLDGFQGTVLFPKVQDDSIHFYPVTDITQLRPGAYQIPEPQETQPQQPEVIFVPGVSFDHAGYRLGYGKGYYDRYLRTTDALTIGVSYAMQVLPRLPHEEHDVRVNYIITETKVIICKKR